MSKALLFIRLDLLTVKPYLTVKNFLIFFAVAFFVTVSVGMAAVPIGILMMYAALYVTYPFAVGEKSGMDMLYATLSIGRGTIVLGRYLFALAADVCAGVVAYGFAFVVLTAAGKGFDPGESLVAAVAVFVLFSLVQAVQLPLFFKLGYTKGKFLSYIPFIGFPAVLLLFNYAQEKLMTAEQAVGVAAWLGANQPVAVLLGAGVWLGAVALSYRVSLKCYRKREL